MMKGCVRCMYNYLFNAYIGTQQLIKGYGLTLITLFVWREGFPK